MSLARHAKTEFQSRIEVARWRDTNTSSRIPDAIWEASAPLRSREPLKPKGGRPRVPDRDARGDVRGAPASAVPDLATAFNAPSPFQALTLAMEDYVLRHAPDWVIGGATFEKDREVPAQAAERRADLERRIQDYAERANAAYGALRPPKQ